MVSINEELELAKSAKGAIKALLTATSKQAALATLEGAYRAAVLNFSGEGLLNEARPPCCALAPVPPSCIAITVYAALRPLRLCKKDV